MSHVGIRMQKFARSKFDHSNMFLEVERKLLYRKFFLQHIDKIFYDYPKPFLLDMGLLCKTFHSKPLLRGTNKSMYSGSTSFHLGNSESQHKTDHSNEFLVNTNTCSQSNSKLFHLYIEHKVVHPS